ncbi:MAG: hypothetical protein R3C03_16740 [Pirellulaceae bacterium]
MVATSTKHQPNQFISTIDAAFIRSPQKIDWLLIAADDDQMLRALSSAVAGESVAVVRVSQADWVHRFAELAAAIEYALEVGAIRSLILAANSTFVEVDSDSRITSKRTSKITLQTENKPFVGAWQHNSGNLPRMKNFATCVQQLRNLPAVKNCILRNHLVVCGLFFREESGLFIAYDAQEDLFQPLI